MTRLTEPPPPIVAGPPTQGGDIRARWAWVEPTVWTERMLTALETGVKGGKWFSLIASALAKCVLSGTWAVLFGRRPCCRVSVTVIVLNHRLESRMREIRLSGLEEGAGQPNALSLPLSSLAHVREVNRPAVS